MNYAILVPGMSLLQAQVNFDSPKQMEASAGIQLAL
jgi:hypothetical protein